ncbi:hypothetical protein AB3662_11365 [Sorangium cellulosum]|uniref:hypothetical protein n=1 Tax=Sorangium cellulosum TaxID=56 RepID=UPI003D9A5520
MDRAELTHLLDTAERAPRENRARMLLDEVRPHLVAPWVDEVLHARARVLCERHGLACPPRAEAPLRAGETWLLLVGPGGQGHVVRLAAGGAGVEPGPAAQAEGRLALHGLHAAAASRGRRIPQGVAMRGIRVRGGLSRMKIEGGSLGLSTAIATLSAALRTPPRCNVAGSAVVLPDGRLERVSFLAEKVRVLRAQWPDVDTLVVAAEQDDIDTVSGLVRVVRAPDLTAACAYFELSLESLPRCRIEERRHMLAGLRSHEQKPHDVAQWLEKSAEAWEVARAFHVEACAPEAVEARLLAAIFASHAGDGLLSRVILADVSEEDVGSRPPLRVRKLIYLATATIDDDVVLAERTAARGVELCAELSGDDRAVLIGQALGTHGRTLLHAGRLDEAESLLRAALEHHRDHLEEQWPRSACYLATCLRHAGRAAEALALIGEALAAAERHSEHWEVADTTALYLHLERGRALAVLGRLPDAALDLEHVVRNQDLAAAYPRLGAHRTLADVLARLGDAHEARKHLRVCVDIARGTGRQTLRRVGGVAAAEALLAARPLLPALDLEAAWVACFAADVDRGHVLRTWVY